MATDTPMQLGMVGLGRMGANLVRRLMRDGHRCVVYDMNADAVAGLAGEGATGADSLSDFVAEAREAAGGVADAARGGGGLDAGAAGGRAGARRHGDRRRQLLLPRRHHPGQEPADEEHPLRRLRDQRRGVGTRARLLPDDRRRERGRLAPRPDLQDDRARRELRRAHPEPHPHRRHRARTAICTAGQAAQGIS